MSEKAQIYACWADGLLALWSARDFYRLTRHIAHGNADVYLVGEQKKRFRDIVLPLCAAGTAGYISDQSAEERMGGILYFRSRYAIAPCLIAEQTLNPQRLVLGNFSQPMDLARFSKEHDLKVIRDYGGGVVLFERGSR